jgi:hypothetical protein
MMSRARKSFGSLLLSLTAVAALSVGHPIAAQDLPTNPRLARGEAGRPVDVKRLTENSSLIVRGRLTRGATKLVGNTIYTFYGLDVHETVKGSPRKSVSVAILGGALGNVQLDVPGAPAFQSGDEIVFFGQRFAGEPSAFRATGEFAGLIPILSSPGKRPVVLPRGRPEGVDEFVEEIRALTRR